MTEPIIILAGATGHLGERIATSLIQRGASVRALVRHGAAPGKLAPLRGLGVAVHEVDFSSRPALTTACAGGSCVVSALSGLRGVIVDAQAALLDAAVAAGVPRFIPSDYSIDFTRLPAGQNRNLDLRREFAQALARAPIAVTSIFNGAFMEILTDKAPILLFKLRRVLCWGDADQRLDFTTIEDTAAFTAAAALDPVTPRYLRIADGQASARDLAAIMTAVTGKPHQLLRAGSLTALERIIKVARAIAPGREQVYPPWQGMQYLHNMFGGRAKLDPLDNDRYPGMQWTSVRAALERHAHG